MVNKETLLDAGEVRRLLDYNLETGVFTWRVKIASVTNPGQIAGKVHPLGYRLISINGRQYFEHRLAWLHVTGNWPKLHIDHINRVRTDNRFVNLRDVSASINNWNTGKHKRNTSGFKGVTWNNSSSKWQAQIRANSKNHYLGVFSNIEDAAKAYFDGAKRLHTTNEAQA